MKFKETRHRLGLTLLVTAIISLFWIATLFMTGWIIYLLVRTGILTGSKQQPLSAYEVIPIIGAANFILGLLITFAFGKIPLRPVNDLINKLNRLAAGDFRTRIKYSGFMRKHPTVSELTDSFNTLAEELENTEMLRSDFINNFSHEFKTPIVSIAGFAKLLKKGNITEEQKKEYLDIIEEESLRLAEMATNVLNLTKIENQTILTDVSEYNLSEQIRTCILLLEKKWSSKNIEFTLNFDECMIKANEELLKQVWINLIDNAIKFSPEYAPVEIGITVTNENISVHIINTGSTISSENLKRIFNKFYQADESRNSEGNGIGLAIVKKVVELHNGTVSVESKDGTATFKVNIPQ